MADFNGLSLGAAASVRTAAAPPAMQRVVFPGVNGFGVNFEGSRGQVSEATGLCYNPTLGGLAAVEQGFRDAQNNGTVGTLTDTTGKTWNNVYIDEFTPLEAIGTVPGGGYARAYKITFVHLTAS